MPDTTIQHPEMPHTNPNTLPYGSPRGSAMPTASKALTKLTEGSRRFLKGGAEEVYDDGELEALVHWMRATTALARLTHDEVMRALKRTEEEAGFIMVKAAE